MLPTLTGQTDWPWTHVHMEEYSTPPWGSRNIRYELVNGGFSFQDADDDEIDDYCNIRKPLPLPVTLDCLLLPTTPQGLHRLLVYRSRLGQFLGQFKKSFLITCDHDYLGPYAFGNPHPHVTSLDPTLEMSILQHDIHVSPQISIGWGGLIKFPQTSDIRVRRNLACNLQFFGLNVIQDYTSTAATAILERNVEGWLATLSNTHNWDLLVWPLDLQVVSLFRAFLVYSGGRLDSVQKLRNPYLTMGYNASLCATHLGITQTCQVGTYDFRDLTNAFRRSPLYCSRDLSKWQYGLMYRCLIGPTGSILV